MPMRAHQASRNALKLGRAVLLVGDDPQRAPLLPLGAAEATEALLRAAGLLQDWHLRAYRSPRFRALWAWSEHKLMPGATTLVALRKRVIDDETRAALEAGASQVLVVGAGFDTLALRLSRAHPSVRFLELDHPAPLSLKRHALDQPGYPRNLVLHPADLGAGSLSEALAEARWDRTARAVVIVESLLMELDRGELPDFLRGLAAAVGPGSRLLSVHRVPNPPGRPPLARLSRASLHALSEPGRPWAEAPEAVVDLLAEAGLVAATEPGRVDLRLRYLVPAGLDHLPLATHEHVVIAERP
ncbi:MAG: SAM-dependent methyltransferase [Myxococcales bacterium]|nr:SAM-dependent methyltransferase [Myxococcales bacterium]